MNESDSSDSARDALLAKVLALPPADREFIAERIDETLDKETEFSQGVFATPELAQAWADEVERRINMIDKGLVKPLPADIALGDAREHLDRHRAGRASS
jgi:putative addiction module component (TIGR02574 family)